MVITILKRQKTHKSIYTTFTTYYYVVKDDIYTFRPK